jgi:hypothetical protein
MRFGFNNLKGNKLLNLKFEIWTKLFKDEISQTSWPNPKWIL